MFIDVHTEQVNKCTPSMIVEMLILLFLTPRMIGWYVYETVCYPDRLTMSRAAFVFAVQTWLAQTPEQAKKAGTPGYLSAAMACELSYNANPLFFSC